MILRSNTGITLSRINDDLKVSNVDETSNYVRSLEVGNHGISFIGHRMRNMKFFLLSASRVGEG